MNGSKQHRTITRGLIEELRERFEELRRCPDVINLAKELVSDARIGSHLTSLTIDNYRKLKNLTLGKASRINLFAGENNSGKTALLEAIYLLVRQNDFDGLLDVMRRRGKVLVCQLDSEWMIENLPDEILISGIFDKQEAKLTIKHYQEPDPSIDRSRYIESVDLSSRFGSNSQQSVSRVFKSRPHTTQADSIKILCPIVFSSPFALNEPHRYANFYRKSVESKALSIKPFAGNLLINSDSKPVFSGKETEVPFL